MITPVLDRHAGTEEHVRLDHHVAADFRVMGEPDRLGRDQGGAGQHHLETAAALPDRLGGSELVAGVDAEHLVLRT